MNTPLEKGSQPSNNKALKNNILEESKSTRLLQPDSSSRIRRERVRDRARMQKISSQQTKLKDGVQKALQSNPEKSSDTETPQQLWQAMQEEIRAEKQAAKAQTSFIQRAATSVGLSGNYQAFKNELKAVNEELNMDSANGADSKKESGLFSSFVSQISSGIRGLFGSKPAAVKPDEVRQTMAGTSRGKKGGTPVFQHMGGGDGSSSGGRNRKIAGGVAAGLAVAGLVIGLQKCNDESSPGPQPTTSASAPKPQPTASASAAPAPEPAPTATASVEPAPTSSPLVTPAPSSTSLPNVTPPTEELIFEQQPGPTTAPASSATGRLTAPSPTIIKAKAPAPKKVHPLEKGPQPEPPVLFVLEVDAYQPEAIAMTPAGKNLRYNETDECLGYSHPDDFYLCLEREGARERNSQRAQVTALPTPLDQCYEFPLTSDNSDFYACLMNQWQKEGLYRASNTSVPVDQCEQIPLLSTDNSELYICWEGQGEKDDQQVTATSQAEKLQCNELPWSYDNWRFYGCVDEEIKQQQSLTAAKDGKIGSVLANIEDIYATPAMTPTESQRLQDEQAAAELAVYLQEGKKAVAESLAAVATSRQHVQNFLRTSAQNTQADVQLQPSHPEPKIAHAKQDLANDVYDISSR